MPVVYVGHPAASYEGDPASLVEALGREPAALQGWSIKVRVYDKASSFDARDFCAMVSGEPGPVLLIQGVQGSVVSDVRRRIGRLVPVLVETIVNGDELLTQLSRSINSFNEGDPPVPLDVVVALLIMRKLDKEHMWTGNAKGYLWAVDLPKGRGVDQRFEPRVQHVANVLKQHGILVEKVSNSQRKVALNPERREEIYGLLRDRTLPAGALNILSRGASTESVRTLDLLRDYDRPE